MTINQLKRAVAIKEQIEGLSKDLRTISLHNVGCAFVGELSPERGESFFLLLETDLELDQIPRGLSRRAPFDMAGTPP